MIDHGMTISSSHAPLGIVSRHVSSVSCLSINRVDTGMNRELLAIAVSTGRQTSTVFVGQCPYHGMVIQCIMHSMHDHAVETLGKVEGAVSFPVVSSYIDTAMPYSSRSALSSACTACT
jgi:hypothetical protein